MTACGEVLGYGHVCTLEVQQRNPVLEWDIRAVNQGAPGRVFLSCPYKVWVGKSVLLLFPSLLTWNNNQMQGSVTAILQL